MLHLAGSHPNIIALHKYSYGPYSYGIYSYGLCSYGLYSYGLHTYGLYSYGRVDIRYSYGLLQLWPV